MTYVDGFVLAVPEARLDDYADLARRAGRIFKEHGALSVVEAVGDDTPVGEITSFPRAVKAEAGEVVVFAWITYRSREHRDEVHRKMEADERTKAMTGEAMPFDGKRMIFGGFRTLVEL